MKNHIFFLVFAFLVFGCKEKTADASSYATDNKYKNEAISVEASSEVMDSAAVADVSTPTRIDQNIETKIIKSANLEFQTNDLDATYNKILTSLKPIKGIIQSDSENKLSYRQERSLTIRIPSQSFDTFLGNVSKDVTYFDRKEISSQDVTAEYVDTAARINAKKKLEQRYLELLKKATKVQEMLEIEKQLSEIREEVEAKEGQLKLMQNKVSMSTINIVFYKQLAQESGARVSFFGKIGNAIVSGFNSIANFFVNLLELWPFILILVAIIYFVKKRIQKKKQL